MVEKGDAGENVADIWRGGGGENGIRPVLRTESCLDNLSEMLEKGAIATTRFLICGKMVKGIEAVSVQNIPLPHRNDVAIRTDYPVEPDMFLEVFRREHRAMAVVPEPANG